MPVLLFDIDGTLYDGHGVGRRAVEASLAARFGRPVDTAAVAFSGKTDPQIFRSILSDPALVGTVPDDLDAALAGALADYAAEMHRTFHTARATALPGAADTVHRLAAQGFTTGLLTGNLEPLAYLKVASVGLARTHVPFGAFGSDHEDRNRLPLVAAERAAAHVGRAVDPRELVIIGDTPMDIACARAVGAVAVAVTTGRYSAADLREADLVLDALDGLTAERVEALVG